jgi:ribosome-binding protein aMBF1 (putative translation factor)
MVKTDALNRERKMDTMLTAIRRRVALDVQAAMSRKALSQAGLARRMQTSRSVVYTVVHARQNLVTLRLLTRVASAVGGKLYLQLGSRAIRGK